MRWLRRKEREQDLERELRSHLDLEAEEQKEAGLPPEQARDVAMDAGRNTVAGFSVRAASAAQNAGIHGCCRNLTGIGHRVELVGVQRAPLPVPEPDRLVRIYQHSYGNTSYRNYRDQAHNATLESLAVFSWPNPIALSIPTAEGTLQTEQAWTAAVSANYFDMLRVRPVLGRTFLPEEDASAGKAPVAVISAQLWRTRFHGDPSVLGRDVRINGHAFVLMGVAPANVPQPEGMFAHQLWVPVIITENLLLALIGGALGTLSAVWGARILLSLAPPAPVPAAIDVSPDWRVLAFGLAISMIIGVLLGVVTAIGIANGGLSSQLKAGGILAHSGSKWFSPRHLLVGGQVALSVVLLIAAGLFVESLRNARRLDLGFQPDGRLTISVNPGMQGYNEEQGAALHMEALRRTRFLPGVISASSTAVLPLSGGYLGDGFVWPEGDSQPSEAGRPMVFFDRVGPGYFETMGARLLAGREFTERDRKGSVLVAVVNETFARGFWPGESPIGKRFRTSGADGPLIEIVGLARDGRYHSVGEAPQRNAYLPFLQGYTASFTFVLKTAGDPESLASVARAELRRLDAALPITTIRTMDEHLGFAFWGAQFGAGLLSTFALLGLVLSAVGLYGVLALIVNRSVPEIGVRMALGATPSVILRLFIQRGLAISIAGASAGILAALAATRALASYLHDVSPSNPAIFGAVALFASYLPSRRAAKIEPLRALRHE